MVCFVPFLKLKGRGGGETKRTGFGDDRNRMGNG